MKTLSALIKEYKETNDDSLKDTIWDFILSDDNNDLFKDIFVYADEKVLEATNNRCAMVKIVNCLESREYKNLQIENIIVNGQRLDESQMSINVCGMDLKELKVK